MNFLCVVLIPFLALVSIPSEAIYMPNSGKKNIFFIPKAMDQEFWNFMRKGVDLALQEHQEVAMIWRGPRSNADTDAQINIVDLSNKSGVDALILAPTDADKLVPAVERAHSAGRKIVIVDSALHGKAYDAYIATNNLFAGKMAARKLAQLLNGKGQVLLLRTIKGSAATEERAQGFLSYLKDHHPGIVVVKDVYGGAVKGALMRSTVDLLKNDSQIEGIFAVNESATEGGLQALRHLKLKNKMIFIGVDCNDLILGGVKSGELQGVVVQDAVKIGYLAMNYAIRAIENKKNPIRKVLIDPVLVTKANLLDPEILKHICLKCAVSK